MKTVLLLLATALTGCLPIRTELYDYSSTEPDNVRGTIYYLPKRNIEIVYSVEAKNSKCVESLSIATSDPVPDMAVGPLLARLPVNQFGTNNSSIKVSALGLLESAEGKSTTQVAEAIGEALAVSYGGLSTIVTPVTCTEMQLAYSIPELKSQRLSAMVRVDQQPDGSFRISAGQMQAVVTPPATGTRGSTLQSLDQVEEILAASNGGLLYRRELPYSVIITHQQSNTPAERQVLMMPNDAPIAMAPVRRSIFGNKTTTMAFKDGALTEYKADYGGDALGVIKLPATVISTMASAIGNIADNKEKIQQAEIKNMQLSLQLDLARLRADACRSALATEDEDGIEEYCEKE